MKRYRTNSKASFIQGFIYKFHNIVSQGPMLICSRCDQLWYGQCQLISQLISQTNNNTESICISCGKYIIKNKVPPCAAVNGMKFPNKPAFFDLNSWNIDY